MTWHLDGRYFESCNCEAICPCRMVGGLPGGRSTHGICFGVLGWLVDDGRAGELDLSGLAVALTIQYSDDEPGSPWSVIVHVDERGDQAQRDALAAILLGEYGGADVLRLPWVRKPRDLIDVRVSPIELEHGPDGYKLLVGDAVSLTATREFPTHEAVRCGIPGYGQPGTELLADEFSVDDVPFQWALSGNCAYASRFAYQG